MTEPLPVTGLSDLLFHSPVGLLSTALDNFGPYQAGQHEIRNWGWDQPPITPRLVSQTQGVIANINGLVPVDWGFQQGWVSNDGQSDESTYLPPLGQIVAQHQLSNGRWVTTQVNAIDKFPIMVLWQEAFPGRIGLWVAPRLAFDLVFLVSV